MRILFHGAPPMADTGYGVCAKHLAPRFNRDHDVNIHSVAGFEGMGIDWEGIHIYPPGGGKFGQRSIPYWFDKTGSDVVFSQHDHWSMVDDFTAIQEAGIPTVLYTVIDNDLPGGRAPYPVVEVCENALRVVVMSRYAESLMKNSRVPDEKIVQIPHGVNTTKYAPVTERISEAELKRDLGVPEDCFLFGMVAANYGPRKSIPATIEAFSRLLDDGYDDAYFYIHAHPTMVDGYNLYQIRHALGLDKDRVMFPDPHEMFHGIEDLVVVQLLNTFDVHVNCSQSESWGLTLTEAMSCGTPVIAANNSAQTEQMGVPYDHDVESVRGFDVVPNGLLVAKGSTLWTQGSSARRYICDVEHIHAAMEYAIENRDDMAGRGRTARRFVVDNYQWDDLWEDQWRPLWREIEGEVSGEYSEFYMDRREVETGGDAFKKELETTTFELRGDSVLDAGCGPGVASEWFDNNGYDVVAIDISPAAVDRTKDRGIDTRMCSVTDILLKDDAVDSVFCQHVLEHVEADTKAMAEMARVAKERVVAIVPRSGPGQPDCDQTEVRHYNADELDRLAEEFAALAGLELEYELKNLTEQVSNWFITVDVSDD